VEQAEPVELAARAFRSASRRRRRPVCGVAIDDVSDDDAGSGCVPESGRRQWRLARLIGPHVVDTGQQRARRQRSGAPMAKTDSAGHEAI